MPIALGEQNPSQRHALLGRTQADLAESLFDIVPGTAGQCRLNRRALDLSCRRGNSQSETRLWHRGRSHCPLRDLLLDYQQTIISGQGHRRVDSLVQESDDDN